MTEIILYHKLSTRSRRALLRTVNRRGKPNHYIPRGHLLQRLAQETGLGKAEILNQLFREREYLLRPE
jgi:hypothetical protein